MPYGWIYLVYNKANGKIYVGQTTVGIRERWQHHCWSVTIKHPRMPITHAIKKYGRDSFDIMPLCECQSQEELDSKEILFVDRLLAWPPNGYNLRAGQGNGRCHPDVKKKISIANKGRKFSPEHRRKLSLSHMGQKISDTERRRRSLVRKGKKLPPSAYENAAKATAKTYCLISPDGERITITNMARFCREHNLSRFKMSEVVNGHKAHHKGWRAG